MTQHPERLDAFYLGDDLIAVLKPEPGVVRLRTEGSTIARHPSVSGVILVLEGLAPFERLLRAHSDRLELISALVALGYRHVPTRFSALEWALR